jgi:3-isopropylmalate/(R)-2-methylmalate dehydratase small subunit
VISTSFADIFKQNSLKNSLLPVVVPRQIHAELFAMVEKDQNVEVTVNLADRKLILPDGRAVEFPVDEFARHCLLEGVDELGYILKQEAAHRGVRSRPCGEHQYSVAWRACCL